MKKSTYRILCHSKEHAVRTGDSQRFDLSRSHSLIFCFCHWLFIRIYTAHLCKDYSQMRNFCNMAFYLDLMSTYEMLINNVQYSASLWTFQSWQRKGGGIKTSWNDDYEPMSWITLRVLNVSWPGSNSVLSIHDNDRLWEGQLSEHHFYTSTLAILLTVNVETSRCHRSVKAREGKLTTGKEFYCYARSMSIVSICMRQERSRGRVLLAYLRIWQTRFAQSFKEIFSRIT